MADHETDDEQLRAIKEWWNENGRSVVAGVVIGVGTLIGWKGWNVYQEQQAIEASDRYNEMRSAILAQNLDSIVVQAEELKQNYSSTPYASWAALLLAKAKESNGETDETLDNLQWVIDNSKQETVIALAKLRLVRMHIANSNYPKAQALLDQEYPLAYNSLLQELRGDLHAVRGEHQAARKAYDEAISSAATDDVEYLIMKRDNLGNA
ncbi:MAG: tetratricopeptide repeat protein [Gammaproteobacteria bacterium]|nr:tetratricopeptide repeat protein [Gammaproteobacteria bacterium]